MTRIEGYIPLGPLNPDRKIIVLPSAIDSFYRRGEAKPGQRQRALALALVEINEEETDYAYPLLSDLLPVVYEERFYPEGESYLLRQAEQSLDRFVVSLRKEGKQAKKIANEAKSEIGCDDLDDEELIGVVTRNVSFKDFAIRIGLKTADDFS